MNLLGILLYASLAGAAALLGTALVLRCETWAQKNSVFLISFATGVMLTIAFANLIPEAARHYDRVWAMVFAGFLFLYILQNIVMVHPCHDEECKTHLGVLSSIGMTIHSLLDGIIISVGFEAGSALGLLTTIAVILHKMPDGITITGVLLHSRVARPRIMLISLSVALVTPLGAVLAYFFLRDITPYQLSMLLALTAGSFIYLAAADLLPETHKLHHRANPLYFFGGISLILLIEQFFPH